MEPRSYVLEIALGSAESELCLYLDGQPYKVLSLPVRLSVEVSVTKIPLTIFSYQQQFIDGALAWIALSKGVIDGKEVSFQLVFKETKEGMLQIDAIRQEGLESAFLLLSTDRAGLATYIVETISPHD